jgi:hypothetical protein
VQRTLAPCCSSNLPCWGFTGLIVIPFSRDHCTGRIANASLKKESLIQPTSVRETGAFVCFTSTGSSVAGVLLIKNNTEINLMELIEHLSLGFSVAFTAQEPASMPYAGCLPGALIGASRHRSRLQPFICCSPVLWPRKVFDSHHAGRHLLRRWYGGSTAILLNGESSSVIDRDRHFPDSAARPLGQAPTLAAAGLGSAHAGCVGAWIAGSIRTTLTVALGFRSVRTTRGHGPEVGAG